MASISSAEFCVSEDEMPKSASTGAPKVVTRMLLGLTSRWTRPATWADSRAPAIRTPISSTSGTGIRSMRYRCVSEPGQYSMTMYGRPSAEMPAW